MKIIQNTSVTEQQLTGWGRCPVVKSHVHQSRTVNNVTNLLQTSGKWSILARGAGRSYGDAALNGCGYTLAAQPLNRILSFDSQNGILRCEAGVSFEQIAESFVPLGWFPKVTPGTKFVTMGGAIAFDVHGKNHHIDGSFSRHLLNFQLVLPSGQLIECSRQSYPEIFWATIGGMGLTGIITEVTIKLQKIETAYINSYRVKARNLDEAFALFNQYEHQYQYSVAWLDCLASGDALGRSILMFGNHAQCSDLSSKDATQALQIRPHQRFRIPFDLPSGFLNRHTVSTFNSLYYHFQPSQPKEILVDYDSFFYPLDFLWDWNRLYGKRGFLQYQFVVPLETSREALTSVLQHCHRRGWGSFLTVLKRLGPQEGWLSFPMPGYTIALDFAVRPGLWQFLEQLDQLIVNYGGRIYLAKDARLKPDNFRKMYPDLSKWLKVKSAIDPDNQLSSALSNRLQIYS